MSILEEIKEERARQDAKWGEQNHPFTGLSAEYASDLANLAREQCEQDFYSGEGTWQGILEEEVYEAIEQAAHKNAEELRVELIQVAAVVVAMIECLDRNGLDK